MMFHFPMSRWLRLLNEIAGSSLPFLHPVVGIKKRAINISSHVFFIQAITEFSDEFLLFGFGIWLREAKSQRRAGC
jgi:hypothetical protein